MRRFRQKHSVPVLSALKKWLEIIAAELVPDTRFGDAVSYTAVGSLWKACGSRRAIRNRD